MKGSAFFQETCCVSFFPSHPWFHDLYLASPFPCRHRCYDNRDPHEGRDDDEGYENGRVRRQNGGQGENAYHSARPKMVGFWPTGMG